MVLSFPKTAAEFPFTGGEVVEIQVTDTIEVALRTLLEKKILSMPVYDNKRKVYRGWFNVSDLISIFLALDNYVKNLKNEDLAKENVIELSKSFPFRDMKLGSETTMEQLFDFKLCPLFEWVPFYSDSKMSDVIKSLNSDQVKRVPILNRETGKVEKIISQNAIMQYIHSKIKEIKLTKTELPALFSKTAEELNLLKKVVTVDSETMVTDGIAMMQETKHTCIGLTDNDQMFLCITTKDLLKLESLRNVALNRRSIELKSRDFEQGLQENDVSPLANLNLGHALEDMTCADFVSYARHKSLSKKSRAAVVAVRPTATLEKIIAKMSASKCHRLFITDDKKPVGVASVRDIVRILF